IGRAYLVSVLVLGVAGLLLSFHASGGSVARVGFALLAVGTLTTSVQAYRLIRRRDVRHHREWMLRSYALIFAAVMLRLWMPFLVGVNGWQFLDAYRLVAWL